MSDVSEAREDWERRIGQRSAEIGVQGTSMALAAPEGLRAVAGTGHVHLSWRTVPQAAGYVIERTARNATPVILTHGGSDVAAIPGTSYADTGLDTDVEYSYRIAAVAGAEYPPSEWSPVAAAAPGGGPAGTVNIDVDAATVTGPIDPVWRMVGSERLSQLQMDTDTFGNSIGEEFADALRIAREDLGVRHVRAHAVFHDDLAVARRAPSGELIFQFDQIDAVYDQLLEIGLRPVVELSFMPAALARDPGQTVFAYRGIVSPPADWAAWADLVRSLAAHLVDRYGIDEVAHWPFEVWNEPNLAVFWTGTHAEYLRLYDESAKAIKSVNTRLQVGGPSTAAAEWIAALAAHAETRGVPIDFVTTHTYGNLPLDFRPALRRNGVHGIPVWWTEWGVGHQHFGRANDSVLGAPFMLSGFAAAQGRLDALAYWVISDHFEELGRPTRLFHDGFGLLTVGNLRKPRYWAAHLAAHQGEQGLPSRLSGDGADVLVQAWASRHVDGTVDVLVWNGALNGALSGGDHRLDRTIRLRIVGLPPGTYAVSHARIDEAHSNIVTQCPLDVDWPGRDLWRRLHAADHLDERDLPDLVITNDARASFDLELPMPGVARVRLAPPETANSS